MLALWLLSVVSIADADHGVTRCGGTGQKACLALASPFVNQYVKPGGEVTWCLNEKARLYPGFAAQMRSVMARWAADLRMTEREVEYPVNATSTACVVRHDTRDDHPCGGCAAWVYTQNMPVLIEYNALTGYTRWDSTDGHEYGHAACLLDEHYDKAASRSYILTYGVWIHGEATVMDVGTPYLAAYTPLGIWYPTAYDLARCAETLSRVVGPLPPANCDPCWMGSRWMFSSLWAYDPAVDVWYNPDAGQEWAACNVDGLRWNIAHGGWYSPTHGFFLPPRAYWSYAPSC